MVAPMEISPTTVPVSDGRPRAFANSLETSRRPPVMLEQLGIGIVIVMIAFDIEENEPGLAVAHSKIERRVRRKFFHDELLDRSCLATQEDRAQSFAGLSAIEPWSGPRRRSLKTRMVKKELAATANCSVAGLAERELIPFNRLRSRSIVTLPFSTIIF